MFYVGTGYDKNDKPVHDAIKKIEKCAITLSRMFGGCSVFDKIQGHWMLDNKLISEESKVLEVVTDANDAKINKAAAILRDALNQTSVLVRKQDIQAEFI
jgi:hypothetical protein